MYFTLQRARLLIVLVLAVQILFLALPAGVWGDDAATTEDASSEKAAEKKPEHEGYRGVFCGKLIMLDEELNALFVEGAEPRLGRRRFYLEPGKTYFWSDGKRSSLKAIQPGDKLAVRYFGQNAIMIAEDVFRVEGKFEPQRYLRRPKILKPGEAQTGVQKPAAKEEPKKEEGDKKAEKKEGGEGHE